MSNLDTALIGQTTAGFMEKLELAYAEDVDAGEKPKVSRVIVLVEIEGDYPDEEQGSWTSIDWHSSTPKLWEQKGLLQFMLDKMTVVAMRREHE
jgi:hypothetical protein